MAIFTIPFPEYDIAKTLQEKFPKKENFSVSIPLSRQQKFYDLLLVNGSKKKMVTIQVKSSRTYLGKKKNEYQYYSWFNNFDIKKNYSDYYFLYMTYPLFNKSFKPRARWDKKILVFNKDEMVKLLQNVKTKSGKRDHFFSFGFNMFDSKIYGARGFVSSDKKEFSKNLLEHKFSEIEKKF